MFYVDSLTIGSIMTKILKICEMHENSVPWTQTWFPLPLSNVHVIGKYSGLFTIFFKTSECLLKFLFYHVVI